MAELQPGDYMVCLMLADISPGLLLYMHGSSQQKTFGVLIYDSHLLPAIISASNHILPVPRIGIWLIYMYDLVKHISPVRVNVHNSIVPATQHMQPCAA